MPDIIEEAVPAEEQRSTVADSIDAMAEMVHMLRKKWHLTENTVLRIIDMNLAMHQQFKQQPQGMPSDADLAAQLGIDTSSIPAEDPA